MTPADPPRPHLRSALVVLSGGQDSTTCLHWAFANFGVVHAITFDYGQRHAVEIDAARVVAARTGVRTHEVVRVPGLLRGTSPLVSSSALDRYENAAALPGGVEKTFVPMRNTLFFTIAANRAVVLGCDTIVTGVSQEDFGGYPDCREPYLRAMEAAFNESLEGVGRLRIVAPLLNLSKRQTVEMAAALPGCMESLAWSHTCYAGESPPCGHCHACLLRAKGFAEADIPDPLVVRTAGPGA
jgi:7-cyano-7-deazaguanine synthase